MVGFTGVVGGDPAGDLRTVPETVAGGETTGTYRDADIAVRTAFHDGSTVDQPVEGPDGALVWVWGEVYSVDDDDGRRSVDPRRTAAVCAAEHAAHGLDFVDRLDGEFVGCVYDPSAGTAALFVDRLGARPLYLAAGDDRLAFSTNVQTVPEPPGVSFGFDDAYLSEYLYARRVFGTKTPVTGVTQLPPATVLTRDLDSGETTRERYWTPRYRPVDKPASYFAREFRERFAKAVADRTDDGRDYGLLMSGGSDSRAVLAAADADLAAYHLADGENREARTARRAAEAGGARFERLDRGPGYHATLLERAAPIQEFVGPFHTGHTLGFAEEIASGVDTLLTGLYSDDLFGAWSVPQRTVQLPAGVELYPPFVDRVPDVDGFLDRRGASGETRQPSYLTGPAYREILAENTAAGSDGVAFHGVGYESIQQLSLHTSLFPITNGIGFDLFSALQVAPTRNPFLDRRLIDLHLSMPLAHRLRHDVVQRAVASFDDSLGRIPHASSRLPMSYPKAAPAVGKRVSNQLDELGPASYRTEGPWQDKNEVVRNSDFVGDAIAANEETIRALSPLDRDVTERMYRRHRDREANVGEELYRLVTVLEMPLTRRLVDR